MPKNWASHRNEIETLYITKGHTLKDVRSLMKLKHDFDASIRAYRIKLEEWKIRKNKSRKLPPAQSGLSTSLYGAREQSLSLETNSIETSSLGPFGSLPTGSIGSRDGVSLDNTGPKTLEILVGLLKNWHPDGSSDQDIAAILGKKGFDIPIFEREENQKGFFDLICEYITPHNKQIALSKAFLMVSFDVSPSSLVSACDFQWWREACLEPRWENAQKKLAMMRLETWMSYEAAQLIQESASLVIGERSLAFHKSELEFGHRLKTSDFKFAKYDYHRHEYMAILRYFKDRNAEVNSLYYKYLLDMMEWEVGEWGNEIEESDEEL